MTSTLNSHPILVVGANGKTGSRVATLLSAAGHRVRAGSRSADIPFDWEDEATWTPVLRGVQAAYVTYFPDLAVPGSVLAIGKFATLAAEHGVARLVLLSGRGEPEALAAERALQAAGTQWTVVRAAWFNQNFSESYLLEPVLSDEVALPAGDVREPFIDADDIAEVAVAALTEPGHHGQVYEVTGPRLLSFAEAVAIIAAESGRRIDYVAVPVDVYAEAAAAEGVPADIVEFLRYLFTTVLDGRNASVTDGVRAALGRPARDFTDYAKRVAASGTWSP